MLTTAHDTRPLRPAPSGMVLVLTLVILMLIAMMGAAVLLNSRTELSITSNTTIGREAFSRADSAIEVTTLMSRVLINQELGDMDQLQPRDGSNNYTSAMWVERQPSFDKMTLRSETDVDPGYQRRYIRAGSWAGRTDMDSSSLYYKPHLVFKTKSGGDDMVVATASVSMDFPGDDAAGLGGAVTPGKSLGQRDYDQSGNITVNLLASVNGRAPGRELGGDKEGAFDSKDSKVDEPHSVVTVIFREVL